MEKLLRRTPFSLISIASLLWKWCGKLRNVQSSYILCTSPPATTGKLLKRNRKPSRLLLEYTEAVGNLPPHVGKGATTKKRTRSPRSSTVARPRSLVGVEIGSHPPLRDTDGDVACHVSEAITEDGEASHVDDLAR